MSLKPIPSAAALMKMSPTEVDDLFADVYDEEGRLYGLRAAACERVFDAAGARKDYNRSRWGTWNMTFAEALETVRAKAGESPEGSAGRALAGLTKIDQDLQALADGPESTLIRVYEMRGSWRRAYLVTDGHVHKTRQCSSCNNGIERTKFSWMTQYSGMSEEEIVKAAGERACTICYPSAPVARGEIPPASVMFTPEEISRSEARELAAQKKKERAAAKEAKSILDVDGSVLQVYNWTHKAHQRRDRRTGALIDVPEQIVYDKIETLAAAKLWLTDEYENAGLNAGHRDIGKVVAAVAAKEGKSAETVTAEALVRVANRKKRR